MAISYARLWPLLEARGITSYKIRQDKIISEGALQRMRKNESVSVDTISRLCAALDCQPGEIMEYIPDRTDDAQ